MVSQGGFIVPRVPELVPRVPGLSIRDCAGSPNNLLVRSTKLSAIDVTAQAIYERLVLVPGPRQLQDGEDA